MADRDNPDFLSASTLKGNRVVNAAGEDLGKIEEFMIDLQDGRVAYAVLSFGGFLGLGNKLFAIPWQGLKLRLHEHAFQFDIPKDVLEKAEGLDKDYWPLTYDELFRTYTYYGYQPYWQTGAAERTGLPGEMGPERTTPMGRAASKENPDFLSAGTVKGDRVVNAAGDDLGKIDELMIDLRDGRIGYAVLSFGGFLGLGDKLFAFPWKALSLRLHEHAFVLNIPREVLEKAEGFDKGRWPLSYDELLRTYTYYGYQPYWQTGLSGRTAETVTSTEIPGETESERAARMERERLTGTPRDRI